MEVAQLCGGVRASSLLSRTIPVSALSVKQLNGEALQIAMRRRSVKSHPSAARPGSCRCLDVDWDPENLFPRPEAGLIARNQIMRKFKDETDKKAAMEKVLAIEAEERRKAREAREVPATDAGLIEFFLLTEAREMEFEIARCRPRLTEDFRRFLKSEIGTIRFALDRTPEAEERLLELEGLQKALEDGVAAYDNMEAKIALTKGNLMKILTSKDKKATLLELAGENKINKGLLALLDENIADATHAGQTQMAEYMGKIRTAMVRYITV